MQREQPAFLAALFRSSTRRRYGVFRNALERCLISDMLGMLIGRIKHVLGKFRTEAGLLFGNRLEARLLIFRQLGTRQTEIAHLVVDDALAHRAQLRKRRAIAQLPIARKQFEVLPELGVIARHLGQQGVVRLAPGRRVHHAMQVPDHTPATAEALARIDHRRNEIIPVGRRGIGFEPGDKRTIVGKQSLNGRGDMFWQHRVKSRQTMGFEQGIGHLDSSEGDRREM